MTDDLVKELRASYDPNDAVPMQVCLDAASRIEKLEAALLDVIDNFFDGARICEIARKALEVKDD